MKTIFISSTFKDMQVERNLIHKQIKHSINAKLREYSEYAIFLDFRWGIDTEKLSEHNAMLKVLSACFDGIDDSDCMIVFIGENYGSCVSNEILDIIEKRYNIVCENEEKSITELEIEYASNKIFESQHLFFYFKESTDGIKDPRVVQLKNEIRKIYPKQIRSYNLNDNSLVDQLSYDILSLFNKTSNFIAYKDGITREHLTKFSSRYDLLNDAIENVQNNPLTIVYGESGSGKSVFMSALKESLSQKYNTRIIYAKRTFYRYDLFLWEVCNFIVDYICPKYKLDKQFYVDDHEKVLERLLELIKNDDNISNFVFFLDGLDKFTSSEVSTILKQLRNYSDRLKFVISLNNPNKYIFPQDPCYIELKELSDIDKLSIINKELEIHHKSLTNEAINTLINKSDSDMPLYLILAIKRLVNMQESDYTHIYIDENNVSESINNYIISIIKNFPDNIEKMIIDYIEFAECVINKSQAINIVSFLSIVPNGLSDIELYFLIEKYSRDYITDKYFEQFKSRFVLDIGVINNNYSEIDFYLFYQYLDDLLEINPSNGKIYFENTIVKQAIFNTYRGEQFIEFMMDELFSSNKEKLLCDYDIFCAFLRLSNTTNGYMSVNEKKHITLNTYIPFYIINTLINLNDKSINELLTTCLFDLLSIDNLNILKNYLLQITRNYMRRCNKEESIRVLKFLLKNIIPKLDDSMLNPLPYVPTLEKFIYYLEKILDITVLDNKLYTIMARLNLGVVCYNAGDIDIALNYAKQCKGKLNAIPKSKRTPLYDIALNSYNHTTEGWFEQNYST